MGPLFGRLLLTTAFTQGFQYCMSNPSFLCAPYRYKTGVLYSQVPSSNLGDFTVTRSASNAATRVNAAGFIETVADNVPRLDYPLGGITAGCPALLVEPSAQNLALQSAAWDVSPWAATSGSQGATVSGNVTTSPDGTTNADKLVEAAVPGIHICQQTVTLTNGTTYTASFFVKASERTLGRFRMTGSVAYWDLEFNLTLGTLTGNATNPFIQNYGNGWYRIGATFTASQAINVFNVFLRDASGNVSYTGDGTSGFFVYGAQLEASSVPTSYIPTTTGPVTRGEDRITRTGITSLIGQTEGTFYFEGEAEFASSDLPMINRSVTNGILLAKNTTNRLIAYVYYNGVFFSFATTSPITGPFKIAVAYRQGSPGDSACFVNGVQVGTTNTTNWAFTGALNDLIVRSDGWIGGAKPYKVRALGVYPTRIPNTAPLGVLSLQSLTQ